MSKELTIYDDSEKNYVMIEKSMNDICVGVFQENTIIPEKSSYALVKLNRNKIPELIKTLKSIMINSQKIPLLEEEYEDKDISVQKKICSSITTSHEDNTIIREKINSKTLFVYLPVSENEFLRLVIDREGERISISTSCSTNTGDVVGVTKYVDFELRHINSIITLLIKGSKIMEEFFYDK